MSFQRIPETDYRHWIVDSKNGGKVCFLGNKYGGEARFPAGPVEQVVAATAANQSSSSQDAMAKLNKRSYQFKRKGNKAQFTFNESVDEHIDTAKRQLECIPTTNEAAK